MEKKAPHIMVCDRIEEGRFCILTDEKKNVLSVPLQNLSAIPIENEVYAVSIDEHSNITLTPAQREKEQLLDEIRTLRERLRKGQSGESTKT